MDFFFRLWLLCCVTAVETTSYAWNPHQGTPKRMVQNGKSIIYNISKLNSKKWYTAPAMNILFLGTWRCQEHPPKEPLLQAPAAQSPAAAICALKGNSTGKHGLHSSWYNMRKYNGLLHLLGIRGISTLWKFNQTADNVANPNALPGFRLLSTSSSWSK